MSRFSVPEWIRALAASTALLALLSVGCAPSEPRLDRSPGRSSSETNETAASTGISPPFFRVEGREGATLSIMGTIHLGPADGWQFAPTITHAMNEADRFILEIDLRSLDEGRVGDLLAALAILPPGTTLDEVVSPATQKLLDENDASLAAIGFPRNARRHKKPWYLVTSILSIDSQKSGYELSRSAEAAILSAARGRPLSGLESFESQLRLMDQMSPAIQDTMLRDTLERRSEAASEIQKLVDAWMQNDQAALEEIAYQGVEEFPELVEFYDALLKERNRRWAEQLAKILEDSNRAGESVFVGVGALHLVGPDNVIELLRSAGFRVESIHRSASGS